MDLRQVILLICIAKTSKALIPMIINTWNFTDATINAWEALKSGLTSIDAVTFGCYTCEVKQCDGTVGYGGSPDESGETTLDAMIFDGTRMDMGAVAGLRRIKSASLVARDVLEFTSHSLLVGDLATKFASNFGYKEETLTTNYSSDIWENWKKNECQPNFWRNVVPDPKKVCGPYKKINGNEVNNFQSTIERNFNSKNHDTIGMIAIDNGGNIVTGTSSNGATHKIAGRVGDSPLPGAGAYADSEVGGAVATGDGDVMMRFLPSFLAVEEIRRGASPQKAARTAIDRIVKKYSSFSGAVVAVNSRGEYGAACNGMKIFPFALANKNTVDVVVKYVTCPNFS